MKITRYGVLIILTFSMLINGKIDIEAKNVRYSYDCNAERSEIECEVILNTENGSEVVVDSFSSGPLRSKKGDDTVSRTLEIPQWGKVTVYGTFKWWIDGAFCYVTCTYSYASKSFRNDVVVTQWDISHTTNNVSIGKAYSMVNFQAHNSKFPAQFIKGYLKITCTDTGTISDSSKY